GAGAYFSRQEAKVRIIDNEPPVVTGILSGEEIWPVNEFADDFVFSGTRVWGKDQFDTTGWFTLGSTGITPLYSPYETGVDCSPKLPYVPEPPLCWPLPEW